MTGLRHIRHPMAVRHTSSDLRRRLLEDLGGHSWADESRCSSDGSIQ